MPRAYTASAETSGGPLPLADGDPANASRDREVDNRLWCFQESLRGFAHGGALPRYFEVDPGGTSTSFTVRVAAIPTLLLRRAGAAAGSLKQHAAGTEITAVVTVSGGALTQVEGSVAALSPDTLYAVYALSDGTTGITLTIAPMPSAAPALWPWRTGACEQRYCGCFLTDGSGNPIQVRAANGRYTYSRWYDGTRNLSWSRGSAGNELFAFIGIPPTARNVRLRVESITGSPGISEPADTSIFMPLTAGLVIDMVANAAGELRMHAGGGAAGATMIVIGFEEG